MLNSAADRRRPAGPGLRPRPTDQELLQAIRAAEPELSIRKSADGGLWIAVELPMPPQHRIYAGCSLLDIARRILGVPDL